MSHVIKAHERVTLFNLNCANDWDISVDGVNLVLTEKNTGEVCGHSYVFQFDCEAKLDAFQNAVTCINHNWDAAIKKDKDDRLARLKELSAQVSEELKDFVELYGLPEQMRMPIPASVPTFEVVDYSQLPEALRKVIDSIVDGHK
ncbi:MAG: hypothetical protein ACRDCE_05655 [Cetobacterium sp.]|uniref:hypothetical protein n=1 Tax=Cetobacterium sp. TaxID=2071632 RepID=UPI003EE70FDD